MADSKLTDLTAETTLTGDELVYVVDDPAGTPVDRKVALSNLPVSTPAQTAIDNATSDLVAGEYAVNTVAASGATETLTLAPAHAVTMDQSCTFTFPTPTAGHTFLLLLSGAFTPTFPASVDWDSATAPTYATPSLYGFTTLDGGTTWVGTLIASAAA